MWTGGSSHDLLSACREVEEVKVYDVQQPLCLCKCCINVDDNESSFRREREVIVNEECIVWTNLWSSDCVQLTSLYLFTIRILMEIGAFNRHIIVYNVFKS